MDLVKFGAYISRLRKERDIPQSSMADTLGVTRQAVSKWERGEGFPDISILCPMALLFGISVDDLMRAGEPSKGEAFLSVGDIIDIAPYLKVSTLSAVAEKLAKHKIDISNIVALSEFLGDGSLAKLLESGDFDNLDDKTLERLIPFLGRESMYVVLERIIKGQNSQALIETIRTHTDYHMTSLFEAAKIAGAFDTKDGKKLNFT